LLSSSVGIAPVILNLRYCEIALMASEPGLWLPRLCFACHRLY
jgi:hypothetical protein